VEDDVDKAEPAADTLPGNEAEVKDIGVVEDSGMEAGTNNEDGFSVESEGRRELDGVDEVDEDEPC
jgi:hypothetical protein